MLRFGPHLLPPQTIVTPRTENDACFFFPCYKDGLSANKLDSLLPSSALCLFLAAVMLASGFHFCSGPWQQGHLSRQDLMQSHTLPRRPVQSRSGKTLLVFYCSK